MLAFAKAERTGRWAPELYHKAADIGVPVAWFLPFRSCSNIDQAAMAYAMPVAEVERIVAASTKRRTGAHAVAPMVSVAAKGAPSS